MFSILDFYLTYYRGDGKHFGAKGQKIKIHFYGPQSEYNLFYLNKKLVTSNLIYLSSSLFGILMQIGFYKVKIIIIKKFNF